MFTGLIQHVGRLDRVEFHGDAGRLWLSARFDSPLQIGESIAVNGACLTLVEQHREHLAFDILRETFLKTALPDKTTGDPLNLERALRMGDPLGGHLVSGHVDGTGIVRDVRSTGRDTVLGIYSSDLIAEMVPKGSIAVDGVSLTLVEVNRSAGCFTVHIIPHTWQHTALCFLQPGMRLNLETDLLGKHVRAASNEKAQAPAITWERLQKAGFLG
jgi:riboflavin synthase